MVIVIIMLWPSLLTIIIRELKLSGLNCGKVWPIGGYSFLRNSKEMDTLTVPPSTTCMKIMTLVYYCVTQCFNAIEILCGFALDHLCRGSSLHMHMSGITTEWDSLVWQMCQEGYQKFCSIFHIPKVSVLYTNYYTIGQRTILVLGIHYWSWSSCSYNYIGVMDQLCPVEPNLLQDIQADVSHMPLMCSLSFKSLADHLARRFNLPVPALNIHQVCQSYFAIVHFLDTIA